MPTPPSATQKNESPPIRRTPLFIQLISVLGITNGLMSLMTLISAPEKLLPDWSKVITIAGKGLEFIAFFGIWQMKLWGAALFFLSTLGQHGYLFSHGQWNSLQLVLPTLILAGLLLYVRKMK